MSLVVMFMIKIPPNRYSVIIETLIIILAVGILTLIILLILRYLKPSLTKVIKESGMRRRRKWWIILLLFGVAFCGVFEIAQDRYSRSLPIFQEGVDLLKGSEIVKNEIGEPIEIGWPTTASLDWSSKSENAELEIPITAKCGKGTLHVEGKKVTGIWRIEKLYLITGGNCASLKLDLMPRPGDQIEQ